MSECWNSVTIYGPSVEIKRFRSLCIVLIFPTLAFDCECIEEMDEFMGFGWYNAPPGGEAFRQGMRVPRGYRTTRFDKRGPVAQARHKARIEALVEATRQAEGGEFSALPGEAG